MTVNRQPSTVDDFKTIDIRVRSCQWQATDWIVIEKHGARGFYYARNLTLKEETPALGTRDDCWAALLPVLRCYNNEVFQRMASVCGLLKGGGLTTVQFSRKWYHPERGHRGAKLKGGPRVPHVRKYLKELARRGVISHERVRGGSLRWKVTGQGKALLELFGYWNQHRMIRGA